MALDFAQARQFVAAHGTTIERARLAVLVGEPTAAPSAFLALQRSDGAFPYDWTAGAPPSLNHTATALHRLRDLGLGDSPPTRAAVTFLVNAQSKRGIWRESKELLRFALPAWMDPESTAADIYTTALCANAVTPYDDGALAIDRATAWLQTQQARDGLLNGFKVTASAYAVPVFAELLGAEGRATRRLVGGIGNVLRPDWSASALALLLRQLFDAGYGLRTEVVARAWTALQNAQQADGSFVDEDDEASPSAVTLEVLVVAHQLGYDIP